MNKAQLVEAIALETHQSKVEVRKTVDAMVHILQQTLQQEEHITLSGLGSFTIQHHTERIGRNPRTGAPVPIPAHRSIKFRPLIELD